MCVRACVCARVRTYNVGANVSFRWLGGERMRAFEGVREGVRVYVLVHERACMHAFAAWVLRKHKKFAV